MVNVIPMVQLRPVIPSLMEKAAQLQDPDQERRGHPSNLGHYAVPETPLWFYVQLSLRDLEAMVVPPAMEDTIAKSLNIAKPPVKVALKTSKFCEFRVQIQWFQPTAPGEAHFLVFLKGRKNLTEKTKLAKGDTIVFKLKEYGFKVNIFGAETSCPLLYSCRHTA